MQFQSTLPQGERLVDFADLDEVRKISIHAPARGATQIHAVDQRLK